MSKPLSGTVHGNVIQLDEAPDLADGQRVQINLVPQSEANSWEEAVRMLDGSLADDEQFAEAMEQVERGR